MPGSEERSSPRSVRNSKDRIGPMAGNALMPTRGTINTVTQA